MSAVMKLFTSGMRQVFRDGMLLLLMPAPFLMAAALWFGLPFVDSILVRETGFTIYPWFSLSDAFVMAMAPAMMGIVCAFLLLDERDEGIGIYYRITPAGERAYLAARIGIPMLWAYITSLLAIAFFALSVNNFVVILTVTAIGTLQGIIVCMLLSVLAGNKVEGLALSKMVNLLILGLPVAWFISGPYKYMFGFLPSFWMGDIINASMTGESSPILLQSLAGIISSLGWIFVLTRSFLLKTR